MSTTLKRHGLALAIALILTAFFWLSRMDWDPEMRTWRAIGDASWLLLWFSLVVGPAARLWKGMKALVPWRREAGVWFGVLALAHGLLVWNGWARWDVMGFLGYEFVPQLGRLTRLEPGFGLSNVIGLIALIWALALTATSADWAINRLGASAWKWLHTSAYVIFYLVVAHTLYFLFMHYTLSFHRQPPPNPNWFQWPFVLMSLSVPILQFAAFFRAVQQSRRRTTARA